MIERVGVIGGGAWGTALALVALRAGREVTLWAREPATVGAITHRHQSPRLAGITLDAGLAATADIGAALAADAVILAVPAQSLRAVLGEIGGKIARGKPAIIAAKGLERATGLRLSEIVLDIAPQAIPAVLSGPSFASDVARGLPTAVTIAAADLSVALDLCRALAQPAFRPYAETDLIGVEIGGAVKNVLAIAAGIVAGRRLGASASAALVARGFAELRRLAETLGARPETLMGLSGLGDLVLTCSGPQSRNFAYGVALAEGADLAAAHPLVEGIETASVARDLARAQGIEMPIVEAVAAILAGDLAIDRAIEALMTRPLKREAE
jgi:glycerol-3-phosphate dehydrogenase (NAD(P)+)